MSRLRQLSPIVAIAATVWITALLIHPQARPEQTPPAITPTTIHGSQQPAPHSNDRLTTEVMLVKPLDDNGMDISGDDQIGIVGKMLGRRLSVMVTDGNGNPIEGVTVNAKITIQPEGARTPASINPTAVSNGSGLCRFNLLLADREGPHGVFFYIVEPDGRLNGLSYTVTAMSENWGNWMFFNLMGGLAVFLFGMKIAAEALQSLGARRLRELMSRATSNPLRGIGVGTAATFATQSSSATTTMLVTFVSSGIMTFRQTLYMILGAAIGTTLTVQLISFNVQQYSLPMVFVGFAVTFFSREKRIQNLGNSLLGFGLIFFGMKVMSDSSSPLRHLAFFRQAIQVLGDHPVWGTILSTVFTAVLQSSGAILGVAISIANQGAMDLTQAMPIIYGANIGTCVTALLASIGQNDDAKRVAWAHLLYKLTGVVVFFPLTFALVFLGKAVSSALGDGPSVPRQIANTHTVFNLLLALGYLPVLGWLEKMTNLIIRPKGPADAYTVKYIDKSLLSSAPELMLGACLREISRMGGFVETMLKSIGEAIFKKVEEPIDFVHRRDDKVDRLMGTLLKFLSDIDKRLLDKSEADKVMSLMFVVNDLENIGDIIDKNLAPIARKIINRDLEFSEEGRKELEKFFDKVHHELSTVIIALTTSDTELATQVIRHWDILNDEKNRLILNHLERLRRGLPETIETSSIHLDLINYLMRIEYYVYQMARAVYGENVASIPEPTPTAMPPSPPPRSEDNASETR
ncbi:MAG: hypothetical protein Kow0059_09740 [Candidatus Sumerlaeia bacterium]